MALEVGLSKSRDVVVDRDRTISFMGEECRVYATPSMVLDIEHLCRDMIVEQLDEGMDSVGTMVSTSHLAATLIGMTASFTATVSKIDGGRVTITIAGRDELDAICEATHERFVVDMAKTAKRLMGKREKFEAMKAG